MLILLLYLPLSLNTYNWNIIKPVSCAILSFVIVFLKDLILRYVRYSVGVFLGACISLMDETSKV